MEKKIPVIGPENYRKRTEREIQEGNRAILAAMDRLGREAQKAGITQEDVDEAIKEVRREGKPRR